jgi:hypothetical protein
LRNSFCLFLVISSGTEPAAFCPAKRSHLPNAHGHSGILLLTDLLILTILLCLDRRIGRGRLLRSLRLLLRRIA